MSSYNSPNNPSHGRVGEYDDSSGGTAARAGGVGGDRDYQPIAYPEGVQSVGEDSVDMSSSGGAGGYSDTGRTGGMVGQSSLSGGISDMDRAGDMTGARSGVPVISSPQSGGYSGVVLPPVDYIMDSRQPIQSSGGTLVNDNYGSSRMGGGGDIHGSQGMGTSRDMSYDSPGTGRGSSGMGSGGDDYGSQGMGTSRDRSYDSPGTGQGSSGMGSGSDNYGAQGMGTSYDDSNASSGMGRSSGRTGGNDDGYDNQGSGSGGNSGGSKGGLLSKVKDTLGMGQS